MQLQETRESEQGQRPRIEGTASVHKGERPRESQPRSAP